jgi:hypothetical protein
LRLWHLLVLRVSQVKLCRENDKCNWDLSVTGQFSVSSMYRALLNNNHVFYNKTLWSLKVESCLEGVNRANLKFTNFKHNYKPGLALEVKASPKERAKTNHKQLRRMTR